MKKKMSAKKNNSFNRILFIITSVMAIAAVIITSLFFTAWNTEGNESHKYKKYYSSMTVTSDDTLWNLGEIYSGCNESHKEYIDNIKSINNMKDDTIYEGMNLIYYYYVEQ